MGWFRTAGGRLIHGEGTLATAYFRRGWTEVDDETAEAEIASGEAQARADVEAELAKSVDAAHRKAEEQKAQRQSPQTDAAAAGGQLTVSTEPPQLTNEDKAAVEKVLDEESPR